MSDGQAGAAARSRPWRALRGVRARILAYAVLLLFIGIAVTVFTVRQILIVRLDDQIDRDLVQETQEFRSLAGGVDASTGLNSLFDRYFARNVPADDGSVVAFISGRLYREEAIPEYRLGPEALAELAQRVDGRAQPHSGDVDTPKGPARYLAAPVTTPGGERGTLVVASLVDERRVEINDAIQTAAIVGAVVLLAGALVSFFAIGQVLSPLRQLTETARTIEESDLTRRIDLHGDDELTELGRTFNAMLDRLETAFSSQRQLIREVGHELRTPITIIRGHLELLGDDPQERAETVDLVTDELDRMARLVDDLLTLARAERPDFLRPEPVALGELAAAVLARARSLGDRRWELAVEADGTIEADPQRLSQALVNLADNAVQQTSAGSRIEIGAAVSNGSGRLWVRDEGPGLGGGGTEVLFERFARGDSGRQYPGTGLGLAIVKAIAEAHHGRVDAENVPGGGARFTIVVPSAVADPPTEVLE